MKGYREYFNLFNTINSLVASEKDLQTNFRIISICLSISC